MSINATPLEIASLAYSAVFSLVFIILITIGRIANRKVLGNGVKCGIINSFLLSAVWPITFLCGFIGWAYDIWQGWKRL